MKGTEILKEAREEGGSMEEHLTTGREGGYPATVASALAEDSPSVRVPGLCHVALLEPAGWLFPSENSPGIRLL